MIAREAKTTSWVLATLKRWLKALVSCIRSYCRSFGFVSLSHTEDLILMLKMQSVRVYGSNSRYGTEPQQNPFGKPIIIEEFPGIGETIEVLLGEPPNNIFEAHRRKIAVANIALNMSFGRGITISEEYRFDDAIHDQLANTVAVPQPQTYEWYITILVEREIEMGKSMTNTKLVCFMALSVAIALAAQLAAQVQTVVPPVVAGAKPVTVGRIKVHGTALEGNLEGDAVDRDVLVFLPPSYAKEKSRRYPVVYALHGYSIGAEQWSAEIHVPQTIEGAFAQGANEMIVVLPDSKTLHNGSMYSSSVTTGDFEQFISHDLVSYIDAHYRTIPNRLGRGLVGHSMGGYGSTRIGMKHADVFGSLYIMSPCCLSPRPPGPPNPELEKTLGAVKTAEDSAKLPFFTRAQLATAAAWSPNPKNPPLYLDLPMKDGVAQPDVLARWTANAALAFVEQYIGNLRQYRGISIDVGDQDGLRVDSGKLHDILDKYGIANSFELYQGTHTSKVADRFQNHVMPFFSRNLCFKIATCR